MVCVFKPVYLPFYIYWFVLFQSIMYLWDGTKLIIVPLFDKCLYSAYNYFIGEFWAYVHQGYCPIVFLFVMSVPVLCFNFFSRKVLLFPFLSSLTHLSSINMLSNPHEFMYLLQFSSLMIVLRSKKIYGIT